MPPQTYVFKLPQNLPKCLIVGYMYSILETLPQFVIADLPHSFSPNLLSKCYMLPLVVCFFFYMESKSHLCEKSCLLGVSRPLENPHSTKSPFPSMDLLCPSKSHAMINHSFLIPTHPILACTPIFLCSFHVYHCDSLWVCRWGNPTSLACPCCQGNTSRLLGHASKFPLPCLNTTQFSINHSKESKMCSPLILHVIVVCPRCCYSHPNFFVFLTYHFFLVLFICAIVESSQGAFTLNVFRGRPYILPKS
jgi:hypothetical protein